MPKPKRKVREDIWFFGIFGVLFLYAILAEWWQQNPVIGWSILIILLVAAGFILYRYASLRGWIKRQVKETVQKAVFEEVATGREPLPRDMREEVLTRARSRCENEQCNYKGRPHIHHINGNNSHNRLGNLIVLCPNCHQKAHDGIFTESQLTNWVRRDYRRLQSSRAKR